MSSIGASLQDRAEVRPMPAGVALNEAAQHLGALDPDAIIFDLAAMDSDWAVTLLKSHPRLLLIGIDLAANEAIVLSGQRTHFWTADNLIQLIQSRTAGDAELRQEPMRVPPEGDLELKDWNS